MKVLVSAHWCASREGSEGYFGWSAIQCLSKDHELWVLTSSRNKSDLEDAKSKRLVPQNVSFIFLGGPFEPPHANRWVARLQSWKEYYKFSVISPAAARELHRGIRFDLVHHVTIATWRFGSQLWRLEIPFVFGPVGGNEKFPARFFSTLSHKALVFELLRTTSNIVSRISPSIRACVQNASHVLAANFETLSLMKRLRGSDTGVSLLSPGFYSKAKINEFAQHSRLKTLDGPLRLFAGGSLEGRKGVALALRALARAKRRGLNFRYRLGGGGPERGYLERLTGDLGLRKEVIFGESLCGEGYQKELCATHVFLLPSLRESAGLTMMEAMLAGCVPVVADCGGPKQIVTEECGYKIPVSNPEELIKRLAETILSIDRNREIIIKKGRAAAERIASHFNEETYRKAINEIYQLVIDRSRK
jgi:glycosyltransferase involved in cell wall biosynthesis